MTRFPYETDVIETVNEDEVKQELEDIEAIEAEIERMQDNVQFWNKIANIFHEAQTTTNDSIEGRITSSEHCL